MAALVAIIARRVGLEVSARQVVQQHLELGGKQVLPALAKMAEQILFVREQLVQTAVEPILLDQRIIPAQQAAIALCSNHSRCKRHSLPGSISR